MERIKKALDLARQQREGASVAQRQSDPSETSRSQPSFSGEEIQYKQTQVVDISLRALHKKRIVAGTESDVVADAYRILRTRVLQSMRANGWSSLAITSPNVGEGKTLTAINLAISLSMEVNHTVLLVDLDLRRPSIHEYFGCIPEFGISEYLQGDIPLQEILFNPSIKRLVVLPGSKSLSNSSEMLSSPKMIQLVEELRTRYPERIILFDLPPLLTIDDALAFSPYVDAVLLTVEDNKTQAADISRSLEMLKDTNIIGTVLNKGDEKRQDYY